MGIIFDIQRFCYHDGPGIRTTVFFKGCQLRCAWCHNPESFRMQPQLRYVSRLCTGCGQCAAECPRQVHRFSEGLHRVDFAACTACGACADSCPSGALKISGYEADPRQVMEVVLSDRPYYGTEGGLTISGGEPTLQPDFLLELLSLARQEQIHTCLETNGYISPSVLEALLPLTDLFLLDYKLTDPEELQRCTRACGPLWEHSLHRLQEVSKPVVLRLPIIPGINDLQEHLAQAALLAKTHSCIRKTEIMPYHSLGAGKWEELGLPYALAGTAEPDSEQKRCWESILHP